MSQDKSKELVKEELVLRIKPGGKTVVDFFPTSYSEFIIDNVYDKKQRERAALTGSRKIYCG